MKNTRLLLTLVLILAGSSAFGQINILDIDWSKFKGAKTIRLSSSKSGNYTIVSFNKDGKVFSEVSFYKGKQCSSEDYNYDGEGRVHEQRRTSMMDTEHPRIYMHTFTYALGKSEELTVAEDGVVHEKKVAKLDAAGHKISETCFDAEGKQGDTYEYSYDVAGNKRAVVLKVAPDVHWADSIRTGKNIFRYEHGNPVAFEVYNAQDKLVHATSCAYVYDSKGNWTKRSDVWRDASGKATDSNDIQLEISYY